MLDRNMQYIQTLQKGHTAILKENIFTRCKCEIILFQYVTLENG